MHYCFIARGDYVRRLYQRQPFGLTNISKLDHKKLISPVYDGKISNIYAHTFKSWYFHDNDCSKENCINNIRNVQGDAFPFEILGKYLTQKGHDVSIFSQNFHLKCVLEASLKIFDYGDPENNFSLFSKTLDHVNATKNPVKKMYVLLDEMYPFRDEVHFNAF